MTRKAARAACLGLAIALSGLSTALSQTRAQTEAPAANAANENQTTKAAYAAAGRWLFDLYLNQSIRLTVANAAQTRPDAPQVLSPQTGAIAQVLDRHRADFVAAMQGPLRGQFTADDIAAFAQRIARTPVELDEPTRQRLIAVDADFRRDHQRVIRAMTFDLGAIVADALAKSAPTRQN